MAYQYCRISEASIRLLALLPGRGDDPLRGEIFEAEFPLNLNMSPCYDALSYAWGDQVSTKPLCIAQREGDLGGMIYLGTNLYSALQHLRLEDSSRNIWCDLVCINQADGVERAHEILRMAGIYHQAQTVVIWLGPEADGSRLAIRAIENTGSQVQLLPLLRSWRPIQNADPRFSWESQEIPHSRQELRAIQKLLGRSWFKRLWVRQEVTTARSAVVMVGDCTVSWTHFVSAAAFLDRFIRLGGNSETSFGRDLFNLVELGFLKSYEDILDILHACRACECTEDQDRVYALLGFLSSERALAIQPDYSKGVKAVYQDLVMHCYDHDQRLNLLTLCETAKKPSWVPDLHKLSLNTGINTRVVQYCWASGEAPASLVLLNDNVMETYGVKCGVLGKSISGSIDKNVGARVLKHTIIEILRDHMGEDVLDWDKNRFEILVKGLLGCLWFERTGRTNHSRLSFALSQLKMWALEGEKNSMADDVPNEHKGNVLMIHIARVLFHGDSCRWTQEGRLGLGYSGCQEGDIIYAILGCRRLMALRKDALEGRYRVVGKFDLAGYNDGEAFLGQLPAGWKVCYQHLLRASNRPLFRHENGSWQWQDPRLEDVALPPGWQERQDQDGYPYWLRCGGGYEGKERLIRWDPRLTHGELMRRGIEVEKLIIA